MGMNPIRVAHILPFSNVGGTEKATLRLAEAASLVGFENILYCPEGADDLRRFYHRHCFVTGSYQQVQPSYHKPKPYLRACIKLMRELRRHDVKIVHCSDILSAHYTALAGRLAGAYVISHVRCQHAPISRRDQTFLMPVQKFIFVSQNTWDVFGMHVPASEGQVLYEGLAADAGGSAWSREEARRAYGIRQDGAVVGMASRVHPCKDFETLIHVAARMRDEFPTCTFLIVGDNEKEPANHEHYLRLQNLLRDTGTESNFIFAGFEDDMPRFYAAIDTFALSTHAEGLPLVLFEAMAHGTPVVATNVGGIGELVTHNETGMLVPERSPEQFAEALSSVLRSPETARQLARAACEHVRHHFSEQQFHDRVKELYFGIAKRQGWIGECAPCIST
jgi:glycosyltransferase involved in cell wall biosynthesis